MSDILNDYIFDPIQAVKERKDYAVGNFLPEVLKKIDYYAETDYMNYGKYDKTDNRTPSEKIGDIKRGKRGEFAFHQDNHIFLCITKPTLFDPESSKRGYDLGDSIITLNTGNTEIIDIKAIEKFGHGLIIPLKMDARYYILYFIDPKTNEYIYLGGVELTEERKNFIKHNYLTTNQETGKQFYTVPPSFLYDIVAELKTITK